MVLGILELRMILGLLGSPLVQVDPVDPGVLDLLVGRWNPRAQGTLGCLRGPAHRVVRDLPGRLCFLVCLADLLLHEFQVDPVVLGNL